MTRKPTTKVEIFRMVFRLVAILTVLTVAPVVVNPAALAQVSQAGQRHIEPVKSRQQNALSYSSLPSSFLPAATYDTGGRYASSVTVADLNGDGNPDVVVTNIYGSTEWLVSIVGVLLGNGNGTFQPVVIYPSGGGWAMSVAVADVNGDGKPDLVVANQTGSASCPNGAVDILVGNGDGTFQPAREYCSGGSIPMSVAVADVNHDGKPDLIVANGGSGSIGVLIGNGDGTFQPAVNYSTCGPMSVVVADLNRDGNPDLVAGCFGNSVGVLLGKGDGTFQPSRTYDSGGLYVNSVAVADVNGDGIPDVVVPNEFECSSCQNGSVGVLLGNGDGTFQPVVSYSSGGIAAWSVAVADVNGDGKADLVIANYGDDTIGVLLGNGNGTFQPAATYASGAPGPVSVATADLNRDGRADVLVANWYGYKNNEGLVGVLLNNSQGRTLTTAAFTSSLNPSIYGQRVTFTAKVTTEGALPPTGKVAFTWGGIYTIGFATLNSSGVATLTKSDLNADPYPLTAVYSGDVNNVGSTSPVVNQLVLKTTSAATITSSPNPSTVGQAVTFSAKITSPTVMPTGPVTFAMGKTVLGTAQLAGGKATFTNSSLPAGSDVVTVTYNGDSNIAKSSASVKQVVQP